MKGIKLFWSLFKTSASEILENRDHYIFIFFALIIAENCESLFPFIGVNQESSVFISLTIAVILLNFVILSKIVLIQKIKQGGKGELKYFVSTFLLYNLYYSFLFFMGLLIFVIPGFYVLIFFSMAPLIAVLDDEATGNYFKNSKILVKKNISLVAFASVINLLIELSALVLSPIENLKFKAEANFIYSIPSSFISMVMTVTMVKIYYYLKNHESLIELK